MANLRPSSVQQILDELSASKFGAVGFEVSFPDSGDLASIVFAIRRSAKFVVSSSGTASHPIHVRMSPGEYKSEDTVRCESFGECLRLIQPWTRRIHEDLRIQDPKLSDLQGFRENLEAHIKGSIKDEGALFSSDEIQDLSSKLDALSARLEEMEEKHELTERELRDLQKILFEAKVDLPDMPKGVWYRTAGGKVWEAMKKAASTSEARQLLADAARKLIGM